MIKPLRIEINGLRNNFNNTMIYLCTHTDFNEYKKEGNYTIIATQELKNKYSFPVIVADNELRPMQFAYSEGFLIYDIWKKLKSNVKWIGINHYRRYFENVKDETTIPMPMNCNMHHQYASCHNIDDLEKCEEIIRKHFPEYSMDFNHINELYPCNMFIMERKDFDEYCKFIFGVLEIFNKENNLHSDEDVKNYVLKNKARYNKPIDVIYQSRLHGFLMERLGTIFFIKHFKGQNIAHRKINIIANKIRNYGSMMVK